MVKLSIIVPIYKVEQYLCKCLDSLLDQDLSSNEYEIILVDDGSPDACPQICDSYAAQHSNIHVVHRENGGLSAARNSGLEVANGEYVCFVDSDDYLEPNVLGELMKQVEREKLDVLRFDYQNVRLNSADQYEVFQPNKFPHYIDEQSNVVDGEAYLDDRMGYACYAWQFVINRELTGMFTPGIHFEDVDWLPRMMLRAKRVNSTTTIVYNYLIRQGSITQVQGDKVKILKNFEDNYYVLNTLTELHKQNPNCRWLANMASMIASGVLVTIATHFYNERKEYIKRLRPLKVFPLQIANQGKTYRRRAKLINFLGPELYCILMHLRR